MFIPFLLLIAEHLVEFEGLFIWVHGKVFAFAKLRMTNIIASTGVCANQLTAVRFVRPCSRVTWLDLYKFTSEVFLIPILIFCYT